MADREKILDVLAKVGGNKSEAARRLGMTRNSLRYRLSEPEIAPPANQRTPEEVLGDEEEHRLKRELRSVRSKLADVLKAKVDEADMAHVYALANGASLKAPKWTTPKRTPKDRAIATVLFSDTHYDEVVNPAELNWVNGYDRAIAVKRTQNFFTNTIRLARDYTSGSEIEGLVLGMLGDMVSGNIHEELRETNADGIVNTCLFWAEHIAAGMYQLLDHFPKIFAYGVPGNHGRLDKKPRAKGKVHDNFDYLIYRLLEKEFKNVPEVDFAVSTGAYYRYSVYGTRYLAGHGDAFKGGTGIAGALSPLMLGHHRLAKSEAAKGTPFDILLLGHWHQRINLAGMVVNSSLKGYDEYAETKGFLFAEPTQSFWLTDPKHGKTMEAPVRVVDKSEGWQAGRPKQIG